MVDKGGLVLLAVRVLVRYAFKVFLTNFVKFRRILGLYNGQHKDEERECLTISVQVECQPYLLVFGA